MSDPVAYVTLMSSLPRPAGLFVSKQTPLSRLKLEQRLRVLTAEDAATLRLVEQALRWENYPVALAEQDALNRGRRAVVQIDNETLRNIVRDRLELRTAIAALRRRRRGESAPSGSGWGFGRWVRRIEANWSDPVFGLDGVFPWLRMANDMMRAGETVALERLILEQAWKGIDRYTGSHAFDIEAVVIYVLKWNIIERWSRYEAVAATQRFEELTEAAMTGHARLFEGVAA